MVRFPDGFLWGASTSGHQIEGRDSTSDWARWEHDGRVGTCAGRACDSLERYAEDAALAASLGMNAYRFGIEWSRVEPEEGCISEDAIDHYVRVARACRERGLQTFVCLNHFTLPDWLGTRGGWSSSTAPAAFERYVRAVVPGLALHTDAWLTLNEPTTALYQGYLRAKWPPGHWRDFPGAWRAGHRMAEAHRRAYRAIKELLGSEARVGLAQAHVWVHPLERPVRGSGFTVRFCDRLANAWFPDLVRDELDFLGVQYYSDAPIGLLGGRFDDGDPPRTDMGWRIAPEGIYRVVKAAGERYGVPLYVTENGLADAEDAQRGRFLLDHLRWLHQAVEEGVDVRGYLHWSLMDNFEWAKGFEPCFGLCALDRETLERVPRQSARLFAHIARTNALDASEGADLRYANGAGAL